MAAMLASSMGPMILFARTLGRGSILSALLCGLVVPSHAQSTHSMAPRTHVSESVPAAGSTGDGSSRADVAPSRVDQPLPVPVLEPDVVNAGQRVQLTWPSMENVAEEFEIVLSLGDQGDFSLRVSPELRGGVSRYEWVVPNTGAEHARIRIRARIGGHEVCGPASREFRIVSSSLRSPERWAFHTGEWWRDPRGKPITMPGLLMPERWPNLTGESFGGVPPAPTRAPVLEAPQRSWLSVGFRPNETRQVMALSGLVVPRRLPLRE